MSAIVLDHLLKRDAVPKNKQPRLNDPSVVNKWDDTDAFVRMLRAHGLHTRYLRRVLHRWPRIARYRIYVYDMRVLAVYRMRGNRFRRVTGRSKNLRALREMAVRTLYSLGLMGGAVVVGLIGKEKAAPVDVNPEPQLTPRMRALFDKAFEARQQRLSLSERPRLVVLGADPEFIMRRNNGSIIMASNYFSFRGRIGHDEQGVHNRRGLRPIVELRPTPSDDPDVLVQRMKNLLRLAMARTPQQGVRWQAGGAPLRRYPIGGHIHFTRVPLTMEFMRALDNYVGLSVAMLEDPIAARRRRPKYGHLGDFRWALHGGFEYRTPSSWLVSETIARAVLHLARLVALHQQRLPGDIFDEPELCAHFHRANQDALKPYFERAWQHIASLPDYPQVASKIDVIPQLVAEGKRWNERQDIRLRWGLLRRTRTRQRRTVKRRRSPR